jgi:hypothetical protein
MVGTPAILSMSFQKGRIMIISPHPEGDPKLYPLVARAIGWTIGKDPQAIAARTPGSANVLNVDAEKPANEEETQSPDRAQP